MKGSRDKIRLRDQGIDEDAERAGNSASVAGPLRFARFDLPNQITPDAGSRRQL